MVSAPVAAEAEIAIAEHAGERDLTDIRQGPAPSAGGAASSAASAARHFAGLMLEPFRLVRFRLAPARFIDGQDRRIENAVAQRLQAQAPRAAAVRSRGTILPPPARSSR